MSKRLELTDEDLTLINRGNRLNQKNKSTDEEAWEEFLLAKAMIGVSENTVKHYETTRRVMNRDLEVLKIDKKMLHLNTTDIEQLIVYWKSQVVVPTINSRIRVIKTYYRTLQQRKIIKVDPMANIHPLKEKEIIKETLTEKEIQLIARYFKSFQTFANYRNLVLFELFLDTGLRISEALNIKINNVMEEYIVINETKSRRQRLVFPSEHCLRTIKTYLKVRGYVDCEYLFVTVDGKKLGKGTIQDALKEAAKAMGITKPVSPHTLRRTYAKGAVMNGIDPFSLAQLMGHEDLQTTKRYVQIYGKDLQVQSLKRGNFGKLF